MTASKSFQHTYIYESTWAGSTKRLELKGEFTAKAGFPLDDSFSMVISEDAKTVTLRHKDPQIISCEMTELHVLKDEGGWWNAIQPRERQAAQNELLRQARIAAAESDLRSVASENLFDRLAPLQNKHAFEAKSEIVP